MYIWNLMNNERELFHSHQDLPIFPLSSFPTKMSATYEKMLSLTHKRNALYVVINNN